MSRDACAQAGQHRRRVGLARRPNGIDHRDRPSAHGGDVGDVDHDAAPAREPRIAGHELVHEAFNGEQQVTVAVRDRRTVVADRNGRAGRHAEPRCDRRQCRAWRRRRGSPAGWRRDRRARRPSMSIRRPSWAATGSRSPHRRSAGTGEIGLHEVMRTAAQHDLFDRAPMQALKQQRILRLDVGVEALAAARVGGGDGEADQRRAERADAAILGSDSETRAPPFVRLGLVDTHGADDLVRRDTERRDRDQRDRDGIDVVAVVTREDALLLAEHPPPQHRRLAAFPGFSREFHSIFGRQEHRKGIEDHATAPSSAIALVPRS